MQLKRTLTLPLVIFYGLGTIIGAGIYALIGTVATHANQYTPISFLLAAIVAFFTASSYAELCSRFPESAGSALYIKKAFHRLWMSGIVGWLVVLTGVVSAATLSRGFINYLHLFIPLSSTIALLLLIFILGGIAIWGITESVSTIMIMTIIEVFGLLIIVWVGKDNFSKITTNWHEYLPAFHIQTWESIIAGAFIAFYAFIGFEDMVNLAEETKNPEKTLPIAIFFAIFAATILYVVVASVMILSLSSQDLIESRVPLALIIKQQGHSPSLFSIIGLISIVNGVLVQIIMASRLIYGMSRYKTAPSIFYILYEKTKTPVLAILLVIVAIFLLAFYFPIDLLAKMTSAIMLCVFILVNLSLIMVKLKYPRLPYSKFVEMPFIFPIIGLILTLSLLISWLIPLVKSLI